MRPLAIALLLPFMAASLPAQQGLFWDTPLPKPPQKSGKGSSAIGQLEDMTGQSIDRGKPDTTFRGPQAPAPKPKPSARAKANAEMATMLGGLLGDLLVQSLLAPSPTGPTAADLARQEAQRQEALRQEQARDQAWANAYSSRMNALISQQRQQRSAQDQAGLEGLRSALSDGWDSGRGNPSNSLAAALSDPVPVAVDLRGSVTGMPSLLREADGTRRTTPVTADELLQRKAAAQARLKAMMAENQDLRVLAERFYQLEAELEQLKRQATSLGSEGRAIQQEMDYWGWRVEQATQNCMERGASLLTGTLAPAGVKAGFKRLEKNPKLMGETLQSVKNLNSFLEFSTNLGDRYDAAGQTLDWLQAKRNLIKDVDFIASNLQYATGRMDPVSKAWELGKTLVGTSVDLAAELDGWGAQLERAGDIPLNRQKVDQVGRRIKVVMENLQGSRAEIAARLGVRSEDLIPAAPARGLGSLVPPI